MTGIYIHGTNGAGKTTLARAMMVCLQGIIVECTVGTGNAPMTLCTQRPHGQRDVHFVGKYRSATGGFDTVQPYAAGVEAAIKRAQGWNDIIFMESLITPGVDTCKQLAEGIGNVTFFWLDVPIAQCIAQMNMRRAARGSEPLADVSNLERKAVSVGSWARRLNEAGLHVERGDWDYVYNRCKEILDVTEPDTAVLLG